MFEINTYLSQFPQEKDEEKKEEKEKIDEKKEEKEKQDKNESGEGTDDKDEKEDKDPLQGIYIFIKPRYNVSNQPYENVLNMYLILKASRVLTHRDQFKSHKDLKFPFSDNVCFYYINHRQVTMLLKP